MARQFVDTSTVWAAFWSTVVAASLLVLAGGLWFLKHRLPGAIAETPQAMRRERRRVEELEPGTAAP